MGRHERLRGEKKIRMHRQKTKMVEGSQEKAYQTNSKSGKEVPALLAAKPPMEKDERR